MTDWFKSTIPGILVLGAAGSIIAIVLLKILGRSSRHWLRPLLFKFAAKRLLWPLVRDQALLRELVSSSQLAAAVAYAGLLGTEATWARVWLATLAIIAFIYGAVGGSVFSWQAVVILALWLAATYNFTITTLRYTTAQATALGTYARLAAEKAMSPDGLRTLVNDVNKSIKSYEAEF